jgi:hypothetical protein
MRLTHCFPSSKGSISIGWRAGFVNAQPLASDPEDTVLETVFEITVNEVAAANEYEDISVTLKSAIYTDSEGGTRW